MRPQEPPFGPPFGGQNRSKNRSEIGLLKKSLQDRPKTAQDPPKMPPGPLRRPQDALRTAQKCPKMPSRTPTDDPKCFPKPLAQQPFSEKSKKSKSSKTCRKKRGRQRSSTVVTRIRPHKNREHFQNGRNPEGGGGDRAKRSFNPPPPAQLGKRLVNHQVMKVSFRRCRQVSLTSSTYEVSD